MAATDRRRCGDSLGNSDHFSPVRWPEHKSTVIDIRLQLSQGSPRRPCGTGRLTRDFRARGSGALGHVRSARHWLLGGAKRGRRGVGRSDHGRRSLAPNPHACPVRLSGHGRGLLQPRQPVLVSSWRWSSAGRVVIRRKVVICRRGGHLPEGRSLLAGDSVRGHRPQAGSYKSRLVVFVGRQLAGALSSAAGWRFVIGRLLAGAFSERAQARSLRQAESFRIIPIRDHVETHLPEGGHPPEGWSLLAGDSANLSEWWSQLAGDSARSHRPQAGSYKSRFRRPPACWRFVIGCRLALCHRPRASAQSTADGIVPPHSDGVRESAPARRVPVGSRRR